MVSAKNIKFYFCRFVFIKKENPQTVCYYSLRALASSTGNCVSLPTVKISAALVHYSFQFLHETAIPVPSRHQNIGATQIVESLAIPAVMYPALPQKTAICIFCAYVSVPFLKHLRNVRMAKITKMARKARHAGIPSCTQICIYILRGLVIVWLPNPQLIFPT